MNSAVIRTAVVANRCSGRFVQPAARISASATLSGKWKAGEFRKLRNTKGDRTSELVKLPDWSFTDGRYAEPGLHMNMHKELQRQICRRILLLLDEMDEAQKDELDKNQHDGDGVLREKNVEVR